VEPLAPHEKLYVDDEFLEEDENHGEIGCETCHGGNPDEVDWKKAHTDLVRDPSFPEADACIECHEAEAEHYSDSLHISNRPMGLMVMDRMGNDPGIRANVEMGVKGHCTECHASCGQCHISRPASVEGGLLSGHIFHKKPPMQEVCIACHGSRVGNEYLGKNKQCKPDVHYQKKMMQCSKCHTGEQMHGDGKAYNHRYEVENSPTCLSCHKEIYGDKGLNIQQHQSHREKVSCYVCHAQAYTNCYSCHVAKTKAGQKYFETESHSIGFKIGLNPRQSKRHPEKFVTVRHVPIDPDTFKFYAAGGLKKFDAQPTWKMATPHNIQRKTTQNSDCNNCHGNPKLFLSETSIRSQYREANRSVVVQPGQIPEKVKNEIAK
jgi:hypothetical protein